MERVLAVNIVSLNRYMFKVVVAVELGEDIGMRLVVDSAERSLAGMVASLCIAVGARAKPANR
jgi:hypothetical protein